MYMMRIFPLVLAVSLGACASKPADDFAKLKPGMDKGEVLGIMGDPTYKVRRKGQDRWTWVYFDNTGKKEDSVHFQDGNAVFVGAKPNPEVSAEERDQANEQANIEIEKLFNAERDAARNNLPKYEEEIKGSGTDSYVPSYEPVR